MTTDGLPASRRSARGNGLKNMRRRLEKLGGHCRIESVLARGTSISFEVNFPA
jgi:signal transduction histidine kinase